MVTVPLSELEAQTGWPYPGISSWIDRLGIERLSDWANREAVSDADARRLIAEIQTANEESASLHQNYYAYLDQRERDKRAAGEAAFQVAVNRLAKEQVEFFNTSAEYAGVTGSLPIPLGGAAFSEANGIAAEEREKYERKHPQLTIEQFGKRKKR